MKYWDYEIWSDGEFIATAYPCIGKCCINDPDPIINWIGELLDDGKEEIKFLRQQFERKRVSFLQAFCEASPGYDLHQVLVVSL